MKIEQRKGISLIVLVITIILMIIIATAIILSLNASGVIGRANKAKEKTNLATVIEEIEFARMNFILNNNIDVRELDSFESIGYELPEKYKDKLILRNGEVYATFNSDEKFKNEASEMGIYTYYVNDDSLVCLSTTKSKVIYDEDNDEYIWEDESGKGNPYKICGYITDCVNNGVKLSSDIYLGDGYQFSKSAIITISNYNKDNKTYDLLRGGANNFYSCFRATNNVLYATFKGFGSGYPAVTATSNKEYGDTIQIATTNLSNNLQKIYVNGELIGEFERAQSNSVFTQFVGRRSNYVAGYDALPGTYTVKSIQLYNRGLTEEEIINNFKLDAHLYDIK